jgi:hypothetical protein
VQTLTSEDACQCHPPRLFRECVNGTSATPIVSLAIFVGLREAVREVKRVMDEASRR